MRALNQIGHKDDFDSITSKITERRKDSLLYKCDDCEYQLRKALPRHGFSFVPQAFRQTSDHGGGSLDVSLCSSLSYQQY